MIKKILLATAIAGTLDIAFAASLTALRGKDEAAMLRFIASGPFPQARGWGVWGSIAGIAVHFLLMGVMAAIFMAAWRNLEGLQRRPVAWGLVYGFLTFVVLDLVAVPVRFRETWAPNPVALGTQLFAHLVFVGFVFAWVACRTDPTISMASE